MQTLGRPHRRWRRILWIVLAVTGVSYAADETSDFAVDDVWFVRSDAGYALRADFRIRQQEPVDKILRGSYPLHLRFELNFIQQRNWWFDRVVGDITWDGVIHYNALLSRYHLETGGRRHVYSSLDAVINKIKHLRASPSDAPDYVKIFQRRDVYVQARFYMLVDALPEPIKIDLLVDDSWDVNGRWVTLPIRLEE